MKISISARLPEMTIEQINMLKRFYELDDPVYEKFSTSRILIICINYFWKHIFENKIKESEYLENIRLQVLKDYNKTTG